MLFSEEGGRRASEHVEGRGAPFVARAVPGKARRGRRGRHYPPPTARLKRQVTARAAQGSKDRHLAPLRAAVQMGSPPND